MSEDSPYDDRPRQSPALLAATAAAAFGMALCLTVLFLGMRTVMITEGGFVAVGGPYVIAHPAPGRCGSSTGAGASCA